MRAVQLPYLQCTTAATAEPWMLHGEGEPTPLPEAHPAWDPSVDVRVSRRIEFDGEAFMRATGLGRGSRIRLVAGFECEHARSRSFPWRRNVALPSGFEGQLEVVAPASRLAQSLELIVGAVLVNAAADSSAIAAKTAGSWLWCDRTPFALSGSGHRFPMEWVAFGKSGLPRNAVWFLDWPSQDWGAPALGTMRLLLNSDNVVVRNVLQLPEQDARRKIVIQAARLDVAKQLVLAALNSDEFLADLDQFGEGSVGFSVRLLMAVAFPHEKPQTLRERLVHQAGEFHAQLQGGLGTFDVEISD